MRIDKFLWCVRYYKTRTIASEACKKGHVRMSDEKAKPSRSVFTGDKIIVRKEQIDYQFEILELPPNRISAKMVSIYIKDCTPREEFDKKELLKYSKDYYRKKGMGRPTKKDRRELDDYNDS